MRPGDEEAMIDIVAGFASIERSEVIPQRNALIKLPELGSRQVLAELRLADEDDL
jgi:hypothetical protein